MNIRSYRVLGFFALALVLSGCGLSPSGNHGRWSRDLFLIPNPSALESAPQRTWTQLPVPEVPRIGWWGVRSLGLFETLAAVTESDERFESTDGGKTWTQVGHVRDFLPVVFSPSKTVQVKTYGRQISLDRGQSWSAIPDGYNIDYVLAASDEGHLWVQTKWTRNWTRVALSTDQGQTWQKVSLPTSLAINQHAEASLVSDGTVYFRVRWDDLYPNDRRAVWASRDEGATWSEVSFPAGTTYTNFLASASGRLFVDVDGTTYRSLDRGTTWSPVSSPLAPGPQWFVFSGDREKILVFPTQSGEVTEQWYSGDGGTTWTSVSAEADVYLGDAGSPDLLAYKDRPDLVLSEDGFVSTAPVSVAGGQAWEKLSLASEGQVLSLTKGSLTLVSQDLGQTWAETTEPVVDPAPTYEYPKAVGAVVATSRDGEHAIGGKYNGRYYSQGSQDWFEKWSLTVTHDHGQTVDDIVRMSDEPGARALVSNDGQHIFLEWQGLFASTNGGLSWWKLDSAYGGLDEYQRWPSNVVMSMSNSGLTAGMATRAPGLQLTADGGRSWTEQTGITEAIRDLAITADGSKVYALTLSGLWVGE